MLHTHTVRRLLVERVAAVRWPGPGTEPAAADEERRVILDRLREARRRALFMVAVSWAALLFLLATSPRPAGFLSFVDLDAVFSLSVLVVAVFSGFRLGQWQKLRAVAAAVEELPP